MRKGIPHSKGHKLLRSSQPRMGRELGHTDLLPTTFQGKGGCEHTVHSREEQMPRGCHILSLDHHYKQSRHTSVVSCYQLFPWDPGSEVRPSFVTADCWWDSVSPCTSLHLHNLSWKEEGSPCSPFQPQVAKTPTFLGWKEGAGWYRACLSALTTAQSPANMGSELRPSAFESLPSHLLAACDLGQIS